MSGQTTKAMTNAELEAIRERDFPHTELKYAYVDRRALLTEVDRLKSQLALADELSQSTAQLVSNGDTQPEEDLEDARKALKAFRLARKGAE